MAKTTKKPASSGKSSARKMPTATPASAEPVQNGCSPVVHDDVAARAYEIYLSRGAGHGRDVEDWLEAESSLRDRY